MAILAPLALFDAKHHTRAVDVRDLQRHRLGGPKPCTVGNAKRGLVLGAWSSIEEAGNLLLGQHRGQLLRALNPEQRFEKPGLVERHAEEEPQRLHRRVDAGNAKRAADQMQAEPAQVLNIRSLGRPSQKNGEVPYMPDVVLLRLLSEMTCGHILDHALAKVAGTHTQLLL